MQQVKDNDTVFSPFSPDAKAIGLKLRRLKAA
jgi:hypothetical protein